MVQILTDLRHQNLKHLKQTVLRLINILEQPFGFLAINNETVRRISVRHLLQCGLGYQIVLAKPFPILKCHHHIPMVLAQPHRIKMGVYRVQGNRKVSR